MLSIKNDLKVPVKFIGVGEGIDDLQPFNPKAFAEGLFEALPEDYEEDDIDLSKIKEEIPASNDEVIDERAEIAKAVGEFFEALGEAQAEAEGSVDEAAEEVEEVIEETVEETIEETVEEEPVQEIAEEAVVEPVVAETIVTFAEDDGPTAVFVAEKHKEEPEAEEPKAEEPKKKKGFFGRLFR